MNSKKKPRVVSNRSFFIGAVYLQITGAVISQGILRSLRKGCGAFAKDTAPKTQVGYNRKGGVKSQRTCPQNAKKTRWGRIAKELMESGVKTQRSAVRESCKALWRSFVVLPRNSPIAIKNGSQSRFCYSLNCFPVFLLSNTISYPIASSHLSTVENRNESRCRWSLTCCAFALLSGMTISANCFCVRPSSISICFMRFDAPISASPLK